MVLIHFVLMYFYSNLKKCETKNCFLIFIFIDRFEHYEPYGFYFNFFWGGTKNYFLILISLDRFKHYIPYEFVYKLFFLVTNDKICFCSASEELMLTSSSSLLIKSSTPPDLLLEIRSFLICIYRPFWVTCQLTSFVASL